MKGQGGAWLRLHAWSGSCGSSRVVPPQDDDEEIWGGPIFFAVSGVEAGRKEGRQEGRQGQGRKEGKKEATLLLLLPHGLSLVPDWTGICFPAQRS